MTIAEALLSFTAAAALLTITPGVDVLLVLRTAMSEGARRAFAAGLGVATGCFLWGSLVSVGLGAVFAVSSVAYHALRLVGAAYLVWLGLELVLRPRTELAGAKAQTASRSPAGWYLRGLLTNLLNPKVGLFYVTFLPQFIPPGAPIVLFSSALAAIHALQNVLWFALLSSATQRLARSLLRGRLVRTLDRLTGGLFLYFGLRLAIR